MESPDRFARLITPSAMGLCGLIDPHKGSTIEKLKS